MPYSLPRPNSPLGRKVFLFINILIWMSFSRFVVAGTPPETLATYSIDDVLVGNSSVMQLLRDKIKTTAGQNDPVLITGESGTGKELIAEAIHRLGDRRNHGFHPINCGALSDSLAQAELFGYAPGTFTGGLLQGKPGHLKSATFGTLFLDEIGDLSGAVQVMFLRVLQNGAYYPVGSQIEEKVNPRIIAATHKNLREEIKAGRFREDLFYRLDVIELEAPALRNRTEDLPALINHFVRKHAGTPGRAAKKFSIAARQTMATYPWPGNVRELESIVRRGLTLSGDADTIEVWHLQLPHLDCPTLILPLGQTAQFADTDLQIKSLPTIIYQAEAALILETLERLRDVLGSRTKNMDAAAEDLQISRNTLTSRMANLGISPDGGRFSVPPVNFVRQRGGNMFARHADKSRFYRHLSVVESQAIRWADRQSNGVLAEGARLLSIMSFRYRELRALHLKLPEPTGD
jgi:two-component system response regulator PilR (NtrC family)